MQQVFYPGHAGEPCVGEYAIALDRTDMIARADIVLVSHRSDMASFHSSGSGRDIVLNRILANDLQGVRLDGIKLFLLTEKSPSASRRIPDFYATEVTRIELDTDDFVARGNPCTVRRRNVFSRLFTGISQEVSYWSGHVVGGCARFSTSLENARLLDPTEIETICTRIGLCAPAAKPALSSTKTGSLPAARNTWSSSSYHRRRIFLRCVTMRSILHRRMVLVAVGMHKRLATDHSVASLANVSYFRNQARSTRAAVPRQRPCLR